MITLMMLASLRATVCSMSYNNDLPHDDNVYRIYVNPHTNTIEVSCIGMEVDSAASGEYPSVDDLPLWMQEKVALLMITPLDKPISEVEGVGRRIVRH
jgi:hypothetical protein